MATCTDCGDRLDEPFGNEGICVDCHRERYGPNHYPMALWRESTGRFLPSCGFSCPVLDGKVSTSYASGADAIEASRRAHRHAHRRVG